MDKKLLTLFCILFFASSVFAIRFGNVEIFGDLNVTNLAETTYKFFVAPDGNVGVGKRYPSSTLDINGDLNVSRRWAFGGQYFTGPLVDGSANSCVVTNGLGVLSLGSCAAGGGISTSQFKTFFDGNISALIGGGWQDSNVVDNLTIVSSSNGIFTQDLNANKLNSNTVTSKDNNSLSLQTQNTTRLFITADGNIGIGTITPENLFDVSDQFMINNDGQVLWGTSGISYGILSWDSNLSLVGGFTNSNLGLVAGNSEKVRITTDGNVGIGTTTTTNKLRVAGDVNISSSLYLSSQTTGCATIAANGSITSTGASCGGTGSGAFYQPGGNIIFDATDQNKIHVNDVNLLSAVVRNAVFNSAFSGDFNVNNVTRLLQNSVYSAGANLILDTTDGNKFHLNDNNMFLTYYKQSDANSVLVKSAVFNAAWPVVDANIPNDITASNYLANSYLGNIFPVTDANILNATRFNQDASCDNNTSCTIKGTINTAQNANFNADLNAVGGLNANTLRSFDNNSLSLQTQNTARITITADGNVGIGTAVTTNKLRVAGDVNISNSFYLQGLSTGCATIGADGKITSTGASCGGSGNGAFYQPGANLILDQTDGNKFHVNDANLLSTVVKSVVFNAFYPVVDANILNATRFNQDASCDNNSNCTITGTVLGYVRNAIFNAAWPVVDANVANDLTIITPINGIFTADLNVDKLNSNTLASKDANILSLQTSNSNRITIAATGAIQALADFNITSSATGKIGIANDTNRIRHGSTAGRQMCTDFNGDTFIIGSC